MEKNCKYEEEELLEKEFQSQVMNMKQISLMFPYTQYVFLEIVIY